MPWNASAITSHLLQLCALCDELDLSSSIRVRHREEFVHFVANVAWEGFEFMYPWSQQNLS